MSLIGKRFVGFLAFFGFSFTVGCIFFLVPLSIRVTHKFGDYSLIPMAILTFIAPISAIPGSIITGLLVLPIIDRALKATVRSRSDYVRFLVSIVFSAVVAIGLTYLTAWIID